MGWCEGERVVLAPEKIIPWIRKAFRQDCPRRRGRWRRRHARDLYDLEHLDQVNSWAAN